jgi:hypothetical protein
MKVEIILKYEEKELLLRSIAENSQACSVLAGAQSASHQPELVAMICDEIEAAEILELAQQHCGSAWRAINSQQGGSECSDRDLVELSTYPSRTKFTTHICRRGSFSSFSCLVVPAIRWTLLLEIFLRSP